MRNRRLWSIKHELLTKSRESMLCAVQIFNNPNIQFKSESFIILSIVSWMYLLHAYYRDKKIDYRYFTQVKERRRFEKTKMGAKKYWELERCLDDQNCPIDKVTKSNLKFLIGLRHEIEHQMTTRIDDYLSARFQACCLNFNHYIVALFGPEFGIDQYLSFSLQFSSLQEDHIRQLRNFTDLPKNIATFINCFDESLSENEFNDSKYSYRVLYVPKSINRKGQADKVIAFLPADSPEAEKLNREYVLIKEREKPKFLPTQIWQLMQAKGFKKFGKVQHTNLWQALDAKNIDGYGVTIAKTWYWYEKWVVEVERYCNENGEKYK